jgi:hypothetical protein
MFLMFKILNHWGLCLRASSVKTGDWGCYLPSSKVRNALYSPFLHDSLRIRNYIMCIFIWKCMYLIFLWLKFLFEFYHVCSYLCCCQVVSLFVVYWGTDLWCVVWNIHIPVPYDVLVGVYSCLNAMSNILFWLQFSIVLFCSSIILFSCLNL